MFPCDRRPLNCTRPQFCHLLPLLFAKMFYMAPVPKNNFLANALNNDSRLTFLRVPCALKLHPYIYLITSLLPPVCLTPQICGGQPLALFLRRRISLFSNNGWRKIWQSKTQDPCSTSYFRTSRCILLA